MNKWIAVVAVLGLALTGCRGRGMNPERISKNISWQVDDLLDDLDASPDQVARTKALEKKTVAELTPLIAGNEKARATLVAQWKLSAPENAVVHGLVDQQFDQLRAFTHQLADAAIAFHQLLTPAQREQVSKRLDRGR